MEANRLALARDEQDVLVAGRVKDADELVVLTEPDRNDPFALERRVVLLEARLLHDAVLRREHEVLRLVEVAGRDDGADLLTLSKRQQVHRGTTLRLARAERQLVHLEPVHLADRGEEEQVVVGRRDEEVLDVVVVLQVHPHDADAAAPLLTVGGDR